uniref:Uncharacterized protein n=1 Tax=Anguilla anguilla TaxID=7936 RepID=A0A0E9VL14_ANGAN
MKAACRWFPLKQVCF